jgi:predicted NAD/FAD-binding protein
LRVLVQVDGTLRTYLRLTNFSEQFVKYVLTGTCTAIHSSGTISAVDEEFCEVLGRANKTE